MLLRAVNGREDFSDEEFRAARNKILEEMAANVLRGTKRNDTSTGLRPGTTPVGREEAVQYSRRYYLSRSVDLSVKPAAAERRLPAPDFADVPFTPLASQGSPETSPDLQNITKAALSAIEEATAGCRFATLCRVRPRPPTNCEQHNISTCRRTS